MPKSYWTKIQTPNGLKYFRADEVTDELLQKIKDESSNVFWAEYDVTQFDDIKDAYDAGKSIYVVKSESRNSYIYSLKSYFHYESDPSMDQFLFTCMCQSEERLITCFTSNWNTSATRHFADYSDVSALSGSVAPRYSSIPCPIPEGTYATKNNVLYKANTTITSEETYASWDPEQWDAVTVGGELESSPMRIFAFSNDSYPSGADIWNAVSTGHIPMLKRTQMYVKRIYMMAQYGSHGNECEVYFYSFQNRNILRLHTSNGTTWVWTSSDMYDSSLNSTGTNAVQNKTLYDIINDLQTRVAALEGN